VTTVVANFFRQIHKSMNLMYEVILAIEKPTYEANSDY